MPHTGRRVERRSAASGGSQFDRGRPRLIEVGLVREVRAKPDMPVWRRDKEAGLELSLKLTAAGVRAASVHDDDEMPRLAKNLRGPAKVNETPPGGGRETKAFSASAPTKVHDAVPPQPSASADDVGRNVGPVDAAEPRALTAASSAAPRSGTKIAEVLALLARAEGASIDELMGATGWLPHTTRAALTGLRRRGYAIERNRENATSRYSVMNASVQGSSAGSHDQRELEADGSNQRRAAGKSEHAKTRGKRIAAITGSPSAA
jgi:Protein of unknown function (DUF3489)